MRHPVFVTLCLGTALALSACGDSREARVEKAVKQVNQVDESNLNAIMMTVADPKEAVAYFRKGVAKKPDDIAMQRGLAASLVRAGAPDEGAKVWAKVAAMPGGTEDDKVNQAGALIRANKWKQAEAVLNTVPPTHETYQRYRLEAMVADSKKQWKKADSFYETAAGMTTRPAGVYNNWGFSKLTRGDYAGAEKLFARALTYDPTLFTAKNNLVLARGAQRKYDLPLVKMTQTERAHLLYTLALTAIKQDDVAVGKSLLQDAIATSPQYFEAAQRSLDALNEKVSD
ncbi:tetratricopeptide repeat protein [Acidimangrovimonas pyrenivorans]|uniref:Tetratricopeptide repeat protein n=1 Tax=Acidimangrovimonas pyrenivorans TaxID=2030798 RepID=A0ABV7AAY7_9RHOB